MTGISMVPKIEKGLDRHQIIDVPRKFGMSECGYITTVRMPVFLETVIRQSDPSKAEMIGPQSNASPQKP